MENRGDVHLEHLELVGQGDPRKLAIGAKAGVVHQQIHRDALSLCEGENLLGRRRLCKVRSEEHDAHLVVASELRCKLLEPLAPPRGQHQVCATCGEFYGQCPADAGAGPGH